MQRITIFLNREAYSGIMRELPQTPSPNPSTFMGVEVVISNLIPPGSAFMANFETEKFLRCLLTDIEIETTRGFQAGDPGFRPEDEVSPEPLSTGLRSLTEAIMDAGLVLDRNHIAPMSEALPLDRMIRRERGHTDDPKERMAAKINKQLSAKGYPVEKIRKYLRGLRLIE